MIRHYVNELVHALWHIKSNCCFWKEQKYPKQMQAETVILLSF